MSDPATTSKELVPTDLFELDQRRAKAYAESGYWKDASSVARALVKIEAGRALGLPAHVAMTELHFFNEKMEMGVGALAPLVKDHPDYDYRVMSLTDEACSIQFYERGKPIGVSTFTMADATRAGLDKRNPTYKTYPRNMLFARAMSNGVSWFCPDVTMGRVYVEGEISDNGPEPEPVDLQVHDLEKEKADWQAETVEAEFSEIPPGPLDEEEPEESPFVPPPPKAE